MDYVRKFENGDKTLLIVKDECGEGPREWDNLGTIVCWHGRYGLGDKHDFVTVSDFEKEITEKDNFILPVYMYDHSGITINTTGFSCPWDSGQLGFIYVSKEKVRSEYSVKRISKELRLKVLEYLKNEIATYDQYLTGDVYGFTVEDKDGEHIDSCYGFYGDNIKENGMENHIENFKQYTEV